MSTEINESSNNCEAEFKQGEITTLIPKIMGEMSAVGKGGVNKQQGFAYRKIEDVYKGLQNVMAKYGVFTVPKILSSERTVIVSRNGGGGIHAVYHFRYRFYAKDGSWFDAFSHGEGIDYGDKVANKCASIAHKYALVQVFLIPTEDAADPDGESHSVLNNNTNAPKKNTKPVTKITPKLPQKKSSSVAGPTEKQLKRLFAITKSNGWTTEQVKDLMQQKFKINSSKLLTTPQYNVLCEYIEQKANETDADLTQGNVVPPPEETGAFDNFTG